VECQKIVSARSVIEVKRRLDGTESVFECEVALIEPSRRAVLIYVLRRPWSLPGVELRPGMVTYAHYWMDRAFNVYVWLDGERTVAHYFNVGRCTEIGHDRVAWTDYAVDVLVAADGTTQVLDEDEVPRDLDPETRRAIDAASALILSDTAALVAEVESETRRLLRRQRPTKR
jgi:predicted RNA-binding protein associated with RNAse of E/G family